MIFAATSFACSGGGGGSSTGAGGSGGGAALTDCATVSPDLVISDFEDTMGVVYMNGTPKRNGYWYSYNDMSATCMQVPAKGVAYVAGTIPGGGRCLQSTFALEAKGSGCMTWGAGIGADLGQPAAPDGGTYMGPKVAYDVTPYVGVKFYARTEPGKAIDLRIKIPMTDETKIADGGNCDEATVGVNKCSDDYGKALALTANWKRYNVLFTDLTQEGWGQMFTWNPAHVTSLQLQNKMGDDFDFWVDDFSFCATMADCTGSQ
jgi:hypothetical protein